MYTYFIINVEFPEEIPLPKKAFYQGKPAEIAKKKKKKAPFGQLVF